MANQNIIQKLVTRTDKFQRRHTQLALPFAIIKKYGDDQGGYKSALVTYYGFLSLFPLLMVTLSVTQLIARGNTAVQDKVTEAVSNRFPVIADQLLSNIQPSNKTGVALVIGLLLAFYGAKGVADAFQDGLNSMWHVPKLQRSGFPKGLLRSMAMIIAGGIGLLLSSVIAGFVTNSGNGMAFKVAAFTAGYVLIVFTLIGVLKFGLSAPTRIKDIWLAAVIGALGLQIIQLLGTYLVQHQLAQAGSAYGIFAIVLGLLFWIYLQVQVLFYAVEANSVVKWQLWPRAIDAANPTVADRKAQRLFIEKERRQKKEHINIRFSSR